MSEEKKSDCRVCNSSKKAFNTLLDAVRGKSRGRTENANEFPQTKPNYPPDREELGRASWTVLHTMAAYFPDKPTATRQKSAEQFVSNFALNYPCGDCASHLRKYIRKHPVTAESRQAFSLWMCNMHNVVNTHLNKPVFDCSKTDERWRTGPADGSCDEVAFEENQSDDEALKAAAPSTGKRSDKPAKATAKASKS